MIYTIPPILRRSVPQTAQLCRAAGALEVGALIGESSSNLESDEPLNWSELSEAMILIRCRRCARFGPVSYCCKSCSTGFGSWCNYVVMKSPACCVVVYGDSWSLPTTSAAETWLCCSCRLRSGERCGGHRGYDFEHRT